MLLALAPLVLAEPAAADAAMECVSAEVFVTSPAPLATDVPIDVVPAALFTDGSCGGTEWAVTLLVAETEEVVASTTHSLSEGRLVEVDPGGDLLAGTTYTLRLEPTDGGGELTEIGFTTGSERTVPFGAGPTIASALAVFEEAFRLRVQAEINVAPAADGASIVAFGLEGDRDRAWTSSTGPMTIQLVAVSGDFETAPAEVCVTARQRDLAGRWSESAPTCVAPDAAADVAGGCANVTGGAPMGGLFGVLLAAALARRPRR